MFDKIEIGKQYFNWLVLAEAEKKHRQYRIEVECQCEKKTRKIIYTNDLKKGKTKSCCMNGFVHPKRLDLVGQVFFRLTVKEKAGTNKHGKSLFKCQCTCGQEVIVPGQSLKQGDTKSCGCYNREESVKRMKCNRLRKKT